MLFDVHFYINMFPKQFFGAKVPPQLTSDKDANSLLISFIEAVNLNSNNFVINRTYLKSV